MKFYLAGPFFNSEQRSVMEKIERFCKEIEMSLFSPSLENLCPPNATPEQQQKAFRANHDNVLTCDFVLARIDDFDPGTMWEMGFSYAVRTPVYAFTTIAGRGLNLMLAQSCAGFLQELPTVFKFLKKVHENNDYSEAKPWSKPIV